MVFVKSSVQLRLTYRFAVVVTLILASLYLLPILFGALFTLLPSIGWLSSGIDDWQITNKYWQDFWDFPGVLQGIKLTLFIGWSSSLLAILWAFGLLFTGYHSHQLNKLLNHFTSVITIPHVSLAIVLILLLAPTGWLFRLVDMLMLGSGEPLTEVDWVNHPQGWGMIFLLTIKEMPFLLWMLVNQLSQLEVRQCFRDGRALGYSDMAIWWKIIFSRLLPRMRLAIFAVLAYSLSVVDLTLIVGPTTPTTLATLTYGLSNHYDLYYRGIASVGAIALVGIVGMSLLVWWVIEQGLLGLNMMTRLNGHRGYHGVQGLNSTHSIPFKLSRFFWQSSFFWYRCLLLLGIVLLLVWSITFRWSFPDLMPEQWTGGNWLRVIDLMIEPLTNTLVVGLVVAGLSLLLVILLLEYFAEYSLIRSKWLLILLYIPLIFPQMGFLFGVQILLLQWDEQHDYLFIIWVHALFVLPYVYLTLQDAWRSFDANLFKQAVMLRGYWQALWKVKLPLLLKPMGFSFSVGFAVSVSQFLPTLYVAAGRMPTITTETVIVITSGDNRRIAVYCLLQWLSTLGIFLLATLPSQYLFINRSQHSSSIAKL